MKIAHFISNLVFSFVSLLFLFALYTDYFEAGLLLKSLQPILGKGIELIFSEKNIIGLFIIFGICILFVVLTIISFIKNKKDKLNVTSFILSAISIISVVVFVALTIGVGRNISNNPALYKSFCLFNTVIIIVQLIVSLIDTVKSYSIEYSE